MRLLTALFVLFALTAPAAAQTRTPEAGQWAGGADIGVLIPDNAFENTLTIDGLAEYYATPRISVRAMLAWASPGVHFRAEDHFRQAKLLFNGVYNWEGGVLHPFATAGAGAYFVRLKREGFPDPDGETRGGINLGGGVEYFLSRVTTIKGEVRFDIVSKPPGQPDATGFNVTFGFKRYF